jgi:AraC family transcriptional regulator of adaptative response/methylated-DNA-[protein]-cysteine methyltransferase
MNEQPRRRFALSKPEPLTDEEWRIVRERDASAAGRFVVGVLTTGIFCRPGCPARTPLRRNVVRFDATDDAERAGFRACRRCRPELAAPTTPRPVERAQAYLDDDLEENVTLEQLGRAVGSSPFHLQRTFKRTLGVTPREYVHARRAERFRTRLRKGETVSRATYEAGYGSSSGAYAQGGARLGMTPGAYRNGAGGVEIDYAIVDSALGRLLVGATARGVCAVALADDDAALEAALRSEYPRAQLRRSGGGFRAWVEAIVSYLRGDAQALDLPVDVRATAFQERVWRALRAIPYGATVSYSELARSIGAPAATRAVARACATNRVALVIPCHRVVREDGGLGGYRWGIDRKRRLLETEREAVDQPGPVGAAAAVEAR